MLVGTEWQKGAVVSCEETNDFHMISVAVLDEFREEVSENDLLILSTQKVVDFFWSKISIWEVILSFHLIVIVFTINGINLVFIHWLYQYHKSNYCKLFLQCDCRYLNSLFIEQNFLVLELMLRRFAAV